MSDQYNELIAKYPLGKMDADDFKKVFRLAFPERPEEKLTALTEKLRNVEKTDGTIRKYSNKIACVCIVNFGHFLFLLGSASSKENGVNVSLKLDILKMK